MKTIIALLLFYLPASAQNNAAEDTATKPLITAVGKPAGKKTEIKINKDDAILRSSDGVVELIIPEGAVPKKTVISIEPVTNLMLNGNGKAYRLEPSGIEFKKPLQLIFHYDDEEIKDSMQLLMGIAMQDNSGQWFNLNKFTLDTVAKTISGSITHFSTWTNFERIKLYPSYARLKVKKIMSLTIDLISSEGEDDLLSDLTDLAPLKRKVRRLWTTTWKANGVVNGNSITGKIDAATEKAATYKAPDNVPNQNPVAVTADLKGLNYKYRGTTFTNLRLVSNVLIYDDAYEVTMISEVQDPSGVCMGASTYKDTGSFVVSLAGSTARLIERVNRNTSAFLNYSGGRCWDYTVLKPGTGNIHIAGTPVIKVTPPSAPGKNAWIEISFSRVPAVFPLFRITCKCDDAPGGPFTSTNAQGIVMMAKFLRADPELIKFEAKEGEQVIIEHGQPGDLLYAKFTVKQLREE